MRSLNDGQSNFPMDMSKLPAAKVCRLVEANSRWRYESGPPLNHPGLRRLSNHSERQSISYCTDVEHGPEWNDRIFRLAMDTIVHRGLQYTPRNCRPFRMGTAAGSRQSTPETPHAQKSCPVPPRPYMKMRSRESFKRRSSTILTSLPHAKASKYDLVPYNRNWL